MPLWLTPWLLTTMLLSYFSAQLIAVFAECDPSFKASDTSKFQGVEGSALAFGLHRIYEYAVQAQTYTLFCVSPMLVGLVSCQKKLDGTQRYVGKHGILRCATCQVHCF